MLVTTTTSSSRPHSVPETDDVSLAPPGSNPPAIAVPEIHPIYGNTPMGRDGFVLERQSIHMLDYWHKKTDEISQNYNAPGITSQEEEAEFQSACSTAWDIFRAALKIRLNNSREVAILLGLAARHIATHCGDDCQTLAQEELASIAAKALAITEPLAPTKKIAALRKGNRLTRAGLLHRYHAFLIGELETVSWNLYGSRDYAMAMRPVDSEVHIRTSNYFKNGKVIAYTRRRKNYPFFDESKLTDRARSVLTSLKIDIINAGDR